MARPPFPAEHVVRHVALIGEGKQAVVDSLLGAIGIDTEGSRADVSFDYVMDDREYFLNLISCPTHLEYSPSATSVLHICDGALIVGDSIEGVSGDSKTLLRLAIGDRIKPLLMVDNIDKYFLDGFDGERAYKTLNKVIKDIDNIVISYHDVDLEDISLDPRRGTIAFSSTSHGWAFTLDRFADMISTREGIHKAEIISHLWGDNFFDTESLEWTTYNTGAPTCKRGFVYYCYDPIKNMQSACLSCQMDKLWPLLSFYGVNLGPNQYVLRGEALVKSVMQSWLPARSFLLEMMIYHLPAPATAQRYRVEILYEGPMDDDYANAIRNCDPDGPLMLYVSKFIPASDKGGLVALGRVFSGNISAGVEVRIMGPNYVHQHQIDLYVRIVQRTLMLTRKKQQVVEDVPSGNLVALTSWDQCVAINATITGMNDVAASPIRGMRFPLSPVVSVDIYCKAASDQPRLIQALKHLARSDPMVVHSSAESGKYTISGAGEQHLENCFNILGNVLGRSAIFKSSSYVSYRETVIDSSIPTPMILPANNQKFLSIQATQLQERIAEAIDHKRIGPWDDPENRSNILAREFDWDKEHAKKISSFGPKATGPNMVLDMCKGVGHLNEIKELIVAAFQQASEKGALAEENMRGICFEVSKLALQSGAIGRDGQEIKKTFVRVIHRTQLTAKPRLMQPMDLVVIQAPVVAGPRINNVLQGSRGETFEWKVTPRTNILNIKAYLPVDKSSAFSCALKDATCGKGVVAERVLQHWKILDSDPLEAASEAALICAEIRKRKGLKSLKEQMTILSGVE